MATRWCQMGVLSSPSLPFLPLSGLSSKFVGLLQALYPYPSLSLNLVVFCDKTSWRGKKKKPHRDEDSSVFCFFWGAFFSPSSHQMSCIHPFHIHPSDDVIDWRSGLESSLWITWIEFRAEPSDSVAGAKTSASGARHPLLPSHSWVDGTNNDTGTDVAE